MTIEVFFIILMLGMNVGYFVSLRVFIRTLEKILDDK